jgi:hypothetical protein
MTGGMTSGRVGNNCDQAGEPERSSQHAWYRSSSSGRSNLRDLSTVRETWEVLISVAYMNDGYIGNYGVLVLSNGNRMRNVPSHFASRLWYCLMPAHV